MIVGPELGYVFVCPPKTGTLCVRYWLLESYGGQLTDTYHGMEVPTAYKNFLTFSTVRNPYERAFSFWHHSSSVRTHMPSRYELGVGFVESCRLLHEKHGGAAQSLEKSGASLFLKIEKVEEEVQKLPFFDPSKPLPSKARVNGKKPAGGFFGTFDTDSKEAETVRQLFANDFAAFGYST